MVWDDIERNSDFKSTKNIILNEFKVNPIFHKRIVEIPKENKSFKFTEEEFKKLSFYALNELPLFIKGIKYDKKIYNLIPYPGLGKIDYLTIDLLEGKSFPELTKKLKIKNKSAILEAYVD